MPGKLIKKLLNKIVKKPNTYKIDNKIVKELPDGRDVSKKWVKNNPGRSLKGTKADFEVSWANYLRKHNLANQNPGKIKNWKGDKKFGGAIGPNGVL